MKKETFIDVAAYALVILFVYASINKLIAYDFFLSDLKRSPLLSPYALLLSVLVPCVELVLAGLLVFCKTRYTGFIGSAILMGLFTFYVWYVLSFTKERPCSCGGIIRNLSWQNHLLFNTAFLLIAFTGILFYNRNNKTNYA